MPRDPFEALLRLQRNGADDARRALADSLAQERAAEEQEAEARGRLAREAHCAVESVDDAGVEAFAAWLPTGRAALVDAEAARIAATTETARARAALRLARAAAEATAQLIENRAAERRLDEDRRAQALLDEIGSRRAPQTG